MGAVFTLILLLVLGAFGIFLILFCCLPLFIAGLIRGKKGKRKWPFLLASGVVLSLSLPSVLGFPAFVTTAGAIYSRDNPIRGERIKIKGSEFSFRGENYAALPYFHYGKRGDDDPIVGTEVGRFLWLETMNEYVYSFSPSYPYDLLYDMQDRVFAPKAEKEEITAYFEASPWSWFWDRESLSLSEEEKATLRSLEEKRGGEVQVGGLPSEKIRLLDAATEDGRLGLHRYRLFLYQERYYEIGDYHGGGSEPYHSCYPLSEEADALLKEIAPSNASEEEGGRSPFQQASPPRPFLRGRGIFCLYPPKTKSLSFPLLFDIMVRKETTKHHEPRRKRAHRS